MERPVLKIAIRDIKMIVVLYFGFLSKKILKTKLPITPNTMKIPPKAAFAKVLY